MSNPLDDRIAAALRAAADQVTQQDLRPEGPPRTPRRSPRNATRWVYPLLAAAVVVGVVILGVVVVNNRHSKTTAAGPSISPNPPISSSLSTASTTSTPASTVNTPSPHDQPSRVRTGTLGSSWCFFGDLGCKGFHTYYVPMWPAANINQADALADEHVAQSCPKGDIGCPNNTVAPYFQPGTTALAFVQDYLDFRDITRVTSTKIAKDQAHIGVGYLNPAGKPVTAAVIHLVRYEHNIGDTTAPWEVVGSDDTTFSLETPKYSSDVGDSFTVGGHITGVDENITVSVLHTTGTDANPITLTDQCCLPAGGENSPWSIRLTMPQKAGIQVADALTIVASTGGHVQQHERFAVQGVYVQS